MKKLSVTMSLIVALTVTACANAPKDEKDNFTANSNDIIINSNKSSSHDDSYYESEDDTNNDSETETPYSFYDVLHEEFNNHKDLVHISSFSLSSIYRFGYSVEADEKTFSIIQYDDSHDDNDSFGVSYYDLESGELNDFKLNNTKYQNSIITDVVYYDGYIYTFKGDITDRNKNENVSLCKLDLNGNEIASVYIGDNVTTVIKYIGSNDEVFFGKDMYVDSNFSAVKQLPPCKIIGKHNDTYEIETDVICKSNDEIYATAFDSSSKTNYMVKYNTKSNEWSDPLYTQKSCQYLIGKYVFYKDKDEGYVIINVETGEELCRINEVFESPLFQFSYYPVEELTRALKFQSTHFLKNDEWLDIRIKGDGSDSYISDKSRLGHETERQCYPINRYNYIVIDSYGVFLRNYKDGDTDEITIKRKK